MMNWYDGGPGWGGWLAMTLMMLVFWGGIALLLAALFRGNGRARLSEGRPRQDPLQILDERLARGEIDEQEYRARRDALRDAATASPHSTEG